ncbi:transglutaminase 1 like 4 [Triplophysa dalaica]|uniref:transglutaminase 1 like 4 n=1 Tax=Triplophysa dalaica TaxID=1582913 RepID=UPI0024DF4C6A|nr:transglutaminase 1 like 4 [Triplophysa dalaica]
MSNSSRGPAVRASASRAVGSSAGSSDTLSGSPDSLLTVRSIDLLKSRDGLNRREHRTDAFIHDKLIVRRGQTFQMLIDLSRPFNPKTDRLHLELRLDYMFTSVRGIRIMVWLVDDLEDGRWEMKIVEQKDTKIRLSVNTPASASIGQYKVSVVTYSRKGGMLFPYAQNNEFYMLFNPWCEDDPVYLDNEAERREFVLNNMGRIYYGTELQIGTRTWNFAQFEEDVLEASLLVLERSRVSVTAWGDPVIVCRVISALVNSNDDQGILEGNWSESFEGGTAPTAWSGSGDILRQYYKSSGTPVKFAQCWVYAGVTNSVLRCLGIPTRCVTNFSSAHDTDSSMTTDIYIDDKLEVIKERTNDSVWNFHVWNESWMTRPDLPVGHGGWQVLDSTPQEPSQGSYRCGPTSVTAVRNGQVNLKYDTPFVFAEVNSDKIFWQRKPDGSFSQVHSEKNSIGQQISTKAVGSDMRIEITHLYKHPEGSEEERMAVEAASRCGSKPMMYPLSSANDVAVEIIMEGAGPRMGGDAKLSLIVKNRSSVQRSTKLLCEVLVMYYTGVLKASLKKERVPVILKPQEIKSIPWILQYGEYMNHLVDQGALMLTVTGRVNQTKQILATQFNFRLRTPDLTITPVGEAVMGKELTVKISFQNPLQQVLKNVLFRIEGLGMQSVRKILYGDVEKLGTVTLTEKFVLVFSGPQKLLASMDCRQLTQVHGVADIVVKRQ